MISLGVTDGSDQITISVVTRAADSYSATGRAVLGTENAPVDIMADVQPVPSRDLQDLPEGVREQVDHAVWTAYDLKADHIVIYNGDRHRVYKTWERRADGFTKALIGKLKT